MNLTVGQAVTLEIVDIAFGGEGVARLDDVVVFVPFVALGETVEAVITEVKKRFARARLTNVVTAARERVEPQCRYFGACGGCQYQHIDYAAQLRIKHKQVCDLFQRIGGLAPERIAAVVPCPRPYGYRNRIMIRSQWNKPEQRLNIGFVRADCGLVEDIEECKIADPVLSDQIRQVRAHPPPKGGLKVVLRLAPEGWDVPADSFFQNNFVLLPELVSTVRKFLKEGGAGRLIDLYCGVGFFGIELSDAVQSFVGVEYDRSAIRAARINAERKGCRNGEFISADVEQAWPALLEHGEMQSAAVLLDPPRKGCQKRLLARLRDARPSQIIYVSCHPATMARDLNELCAEGVFDLVRVVPVDMFPQTQHIECVADLRCRAY